MQFSVWPGATQGWSDLLEVCRHAELTGWDRLYIADHFMPNAPVDDDEAVSEPMLECWSLISALAAAVPRVRIGSLVCSATYRHPAVLANIAATADVISGGRIVLGLGAGWQENEHARYGIALGSVRERLDRFEEACRIVRSLVDNARTDFSGEYYRLEQAPLEPKPVGPMPLLVGGGGEKRTLRIVARWAQEWNVWSTPQVFAHKRSVLERHCADVGRDPGEIHCSTQALLFLSDDEARNTELRGKVDRGLIGTPPELVEQLEAYRAAGVDEFIVPDFTLGTGERRRESLDRFREEVAVHLT